MQPFEPGDEKQRSPFWDRVWRELITEKKEYGKTSPLHDLLMGLIWVTVFVVGLFFLGLVLMLLIIIGHLLGIW